MLRATLGKPVEMKFYYVYILQSELHETAFLLASETFEDGDRRDTCPTRMGRTYLFECSKCGYRARVSGGADRGRHVVVQTILCADCKELYDAVIAFKPSGHWEFHPKTAPKFAAY